MNDIQTLMRSANPIPDAEQEFTETDVQALLTLTMTRSGEMDVKEIMTPVEPDKKRSGWFVAAAAFGAVIIVAGLALMLTRSTEELPPATTPTTVSVTQTTIAPEPAPDAAPVVPTTVVPTTTAPVPSAESLAVISAFEAAWNAGDTDALEALFTPGIAISVGSADNALSFETFLVAMAANQAREEALRIEECRANGESVTCEVYVDGAVWEALYLMPGHSRETYKVVDGKFVEFTHTCILGCEAEFENLVIAWVRTISPGDADEMAGPIIGTTTGPDIGALWLKYAPLWNEAGRP